VTVDAAGPAQVLLGIIGMGYAGRQQCQAATSVESIRVVAAAEASPGGGKSLPADLQVYRDWRPLLKGSEVSAVSICLPHHLHAEVAIAALQAGKHVLIEKPLAMTLAEAESIVEAARAAGRMLMVEMTHRFYPPVLAAREMVLSGRLGRIYAVEDRIIDPVVPERMAPWMFRRRLAGGGVALTDGIHMIDRVAWVCGQALRFHSGIAGWTHHLGDVEDSAAMQLSLVDGTPVAILTSFPRSIAPLDDELTIYGSRGTLRVWAWRGWRFEPAGGPAEERTSYPADADHFARVRVGMAGALAEFAAAISERRPPSPTPEDALAAQRILEAFYAHL
jgi:predicted dehydrogenase